MIELRSAIMAYQDVLKYIPLAYMNAGESCPWWSRLSHELKMAASSKHDRVICIDLSSTSGHIDADTAVDRCVCTWNESVVVVRLGSKQLVHCGVIPPAEVSVATVLCILMPRTSTSFIYLTHLQHVRSCRQAEGEVCA